MFINILFKLNKNGDGHLLKNKNKNKIQNRDGQVVIGFQLTYNNYN